VPPKGGDGDNWLVVSPRRRKARRQAVRRQEWQRDENRFREGNFADKRQTRARVSHKVFDGSDADYYQDKIVNRYIEDSDRDWDHCEFRGYNGGF